VTKLYKPLQNNQ